MESRKSLATNVLLNSVKQLCSVFIPLVTIPYISRVLQAENYGKYNFSNSIISYISLLAGLGIQAYAVREGARIREDKNQFNTFASEIFTINILTTIVAYLCLFIATFSVKLQPYKELLFIQGLTVLFTTIGTDWINTIYEDFYYITIRYITIQIIMIAAMFAFIHEPGDYIKYALIVSISSAGANIFNIAHVRRYAHVKFRLSPALKNHIAPILILFANQLAVSIYVNSDITLLGLLMDDQSVGIYSVSSKVYAIIKQLLNAIVIVAVPRLSSLLGQMEETVYEQTCKKIQSGLMTILLPAITGLFMTSQYIIRIIGGIEYEGGTTSLKILSISLFSATLACFYANCILIPFKKDKTLLLTTIAGAATNLLLNFVFIPKLGINGAALTTLIGETVVCVGAYLYSSKLYKISVNKKNIISSLVGCLIIIIICKLVPMLLENWVLIFIVDVFASVFAYIVCLIGFKNDLIEQSIKKLVQKSK